MLPDNQIISMGKNLAQIFNSSLKFTPVMEEVLLALLVYFLLEGKSKLEKIIPDLQVLLQRSTNSLGSALKSLAESNFIKYYRDGKNRSIELNLENDFVVSLLVRFFGIVNVLDKKETKLTYTLQGFFPVESVEEIIKLFSEKEAAITLLISENKDCLSFYDELLSREEIGKQLMKIDLEEFEESRVYTLFIDKFFSEISNKQSTQTATVSYKEIREILEKLIERERITPPWFPIVATNYNPLLIDRNEL
ncbi:MAG: hypothetical protein ACFFDW_16750 [Candidatus Thorarchaeota archaeon]